MRSTLQVFQKALDHAQTPPVTRGLSATGMFTQIVEASIFQVLEPLCMLSDIVEQVNLEQQ